jgi:putative toxin-antitoxin system antitoxin component (TIGR02293 family)
MLERVRPKRPHKLSPLEPLVRVIARAVEVLGTSEKALRWLNTPIRSVGDQTPASLLISPEGITRVEDALGRIEHGVW